MIQLIVVILSGHLDLTLRCAIFFPLILHVEMAANQSMQDTNHPTSLIKVTIANLLELQAAIITVPRPLILVWQP